MSRRLFRLRGVFYLALVFIVLFSMAACGGESSDSGNNDEQEDGDESDGDDSVDGDESADGDGLVDGDGMADGDNSADGDAVADGDEATDGDESVDGDDVTDGDESVDGDDVTDGDEPVDGDESPDGDEEPDPPEISGYVSLWESSMIMDYKGTTSTTVSISASFVENNADSVNPPVEVGQCKVYPYNPNASQVTVLDAGRITVTGAAVSPVYSDCGDSPKDGDRCMYYFTDVYQLTNLFDPGDSISAQVAGKGQIPAFDLSISAPSDISNLSPNIMSASYTYEAGSPLSFTWTAGDGMVQISVQAYVYSNYQIVSGYSIFCYTEDDGSFAVPSEALDYLSASSNYASISVSRQATVADRKNDVEATLSIGTQKTHVWSYIN